MKSSILHLQENAVPTVDFTLADIDALIDRKLDARFAKERKHTRQIVRKEVQQTVQQSEHRIIAEFTSFITHNFNPAIDSLQSQVDSLQSQVNEIKTDVQDIKRQLRPRLV